MVTKIPLREELKQREQERKTPRPGQDSSFPNGKLGVRTPAQRPR